MPRNSKRNKEIKSSGPIPWTGLPPHFCQSCGDRICNVFYYARKRRDLWFIVCPSCWKVLDRQTGPASGNRYCFYNGLGFYRTNNLAEKNINLAKLFPKEKSEVDITPSPMYPEPFQME